LNALIRLIAVFSVLVFQPVAFGATQDDAVRVVAQTHQSTESTINGQDAYVIYVGQFDGCDSVSVRSHRDHYQHFRVCKGNVNPRNTVAPSWPADHGPMQELASVVRNAFLDGAAQQIDDNGYLIAGRVRGPDQGKCKTVQVIISYSGDLVDIADKRICQ